ncbi:Feline leukemia virus subgroup C receptor-related protein 2 [Thelohanellus kitauei]|uniref:Feline leukemia virus subgroup C receptor-related protein 2 n=1 Tax=Thelohanellus kitauei TaxID=669202 RepID=A0A0C2IY14_THEKT|nr:Feline leukemia virus subgroup C receptor-related protein 2 [Thelohanellus kitauei]
MIPEPDYRDGETITVSFGASAFKSDKRRWLVLLALSLGLLMNGELWMTFDTVKDQTKTFFNASDSSVQFFFTVFLTSYSIAAVPCVILPQVIGSTATLVFGCFFNLLASAFRCLVLFVIERNKKAALALALIGNGSGGVAMAFIFSIPTLISSIWFGDNERSISTSIPFMSNSFGVGLGYLDIFLIMGSSTDLKIIKHSFSRVFIFEVVICGATFLLSLAAGFVCRSSQINALGTNKTAISKTLSTKSLIKQTLMETCKVFKNPAAIYSLVAFTFNYGNYMILFVFLSDIVTHFVKNESSVTGYIGSAGVIIGGFNTLIAGIVMNKTRDKKILCGIIVNLILAVFLIVVIIVISLSAFNNVSAMILFITIISFCPVYMAVGTEILAQITHPIDPNLSSTPAFIFGNIFGAIMPLILALFAEYIRFYIIMGFCIVLYLLSAIFLVVISKKRRE